MKKSRNIVIIVGIETVRDKNGKVIKTSETFMNSARTYEKDRPDDFVAILDARRYLKEANPMNVLLGDVRSAFGHDVGLCADELVFIGHSDPTTLYVFSRVRTELPDNQRFITKETDLYLPMEDDGNIRIIGCQAGGTHGKKMDECIAQSLADKLMVDSYAYTSRCAQIKRKDGGFEQRPDYPGFAKFTPRVIPT